MDKTINTIGYLLDCLIADSGNNHVLDINHKSTTRVLEPETSEIFTGGEDFLVLDKSEFDKLEKTLTLYRKEKKLQTYFICVQHPVKSLGNTKSVYTPFVLYDTKLTKIDGFHFLKIDRQSARINPVFKTFLENKPSLDANECWKQLTNHVQSYEGKFENIIPLQNKLEEFYSNIDVKRLDSFPTLKRLSSVKRIKASDNLIFTTNAGICITANGKNSLGIIRELETLLENNESNETIETVLTNTPPKSLKSFPTTPITVPSLLSDAQEKILNNVSKFQKSIIIGPPGTGKSYTIAAMAINEMNKGKSVLITSSNAQAVKVIEDKIQNEFGLNDITTRYSSKRKYNSTLIRNLYKWLNGIGIKQDYKSLYKEYSRKLKNYNSRIEKIIHSIEKTETEEIRYSKLFETSDKNLWQKIKTSYYKWRVSDNHNISKEVEELLNLLNKRVEILKKVIGSGFKYRLKNALNADRESFVNFRLGVKSKISGERDEYLSKVNYNTITQAFPIWLCALTDLHKTVPLKKNLFDLIIIDEASQVNIASVIPALYRAKNVVIYGDPKQLRHVSFLSNHKLNQLSDKYGVSPSEMNYRTDSILDLISKHVKSQNQVTFLDEHYRSQPEIIHYSNQNFYENGLTIMTETPHEKEHNGLRNINITAERDNNGVNHSEVTEAVALVKEIITKEKDLPSNLKSSIGILSPFRDQINAIQKQITEHIETEDLKKHNLLTGTAHSFQGEERDVMIISNAVTENCHIGSFNHINNPNILNVSITRARHKQIILNSIADNGKFGLISNYLNHIENYDSSENIKDQELNHDQFTKAIKEWLENDGWNVKTSHLIAGVKIDFLITKQSKILCVDLYGGISDMKHKLSLKHLRVINQLKLPLYILTYSQFIFNRNLALEEIHQYAQPIK